MEMIGIPHRLHSQVLSSIRRSTALLQEWAADFKQTIKLLPMIIVKHWCIQPLAGEGHASLAQKFVHVDY